jgi:hypothetical protein
LFTLGLIVVASLRTVGHYVLENIKVKSGNGINPKMYKGILFVFKDELSSVLGNRKKDVQDFLDQFEKQLTLHTFNGKEYYRADNLRQTINATE